MDVTNLILKLESALTINPLDLQMISKAIQLLKLGAVEYVTSYANLPDYRSSIGKLYYVDRDGLYLAGTYGWAYVFRDNVSVLWSWGGNTYGQLGDCTTVSRSSPVSVIGGFTDWSQVSAGSGFSLGVRTDGTAWAWGTNNYGRLGDGTVVAKSSPVSVVGGFTDWCQVSAGNGFSLGVRTNGTAWAWGCNTQGQLGDCASTNKSSPVSVVGGFTDWCQVSAGNLHSLGVRTNGTAWAWGLGSYGRLGDNNASTRSSPVSVVGGFTDWCQVSAGGFHSLGVRFNGSAWAWGCNAQAQLGDCTAVSRSSPVSVIGGFTDWCQVSAGLTHSLAVRTNGSAWAWGAGTCGTLGDGTTVSKSSPVQVCGGFTDWCQVSAGRQHSLGVRTNGSAWAWGSNNCGQLGDCTTVQTSSPVSVVGGFTDWSQVSANGNAAALNFSIGIRKIQS